MCMVVTQYTGANIRIVKFPIQNNSIDEFVDMGNILKFRNKCFMYKIDWAHLCDNVNSKT